jgi:hypothetical protein
VGDDELFPAIELHLLDRSAATRVPHPSPVLG